MGNLTCCYRPDEKKRGGTNVKTLLRRTEKTSKRRKRIDDLVVDVLKREERGERLQKKREKNKEKKLNEDKESSSESDGGIQNTTLGLAVDGHQYVKHAEAENDCFTECTSKTGDKNGEQYPTIENKSFKKEKVRDCDKRHIEFQINDNNLEKPHTDGGIKLFTTHHIDKKLEKGYKSCTINASDDGKGPTYASELSTDEQHNSKSSTGESEAHTKERQADKETHTDDTAGKDGQLPGKPDEDFIGHGMEEETNDVDIQAEGPMNKLSNEQYENNVTLKKDGEECVSDGDMISEGCAHIDVARNFNISNEKIYLIADTGGTISTTFEDNIESLVTDEADNREKCLGTKPVDLDEESFVLDENDNKVGQQLQNESLDYTNDTNSEENVAKELRNQCVEHELEIDESTDNSLPTDNVYPTMVKTIEVTRRSDYAETMEFTKIDKDDISDDRCVTTVCSIVNGTDSISTKTPHDNLHSNADEMIKSSPELKTECSKLPPESDTTDGPSSKVSCETVDLTNDSSKTIFDRDITSSASNTVSSSSDHIKSVETYTHDLNPNKQVLVETKERKENLEVKPQDSRVRCISISRYLPKSAKEFNPLRRVPMLPKYNTMSVFEQENKKAKVAKLLSKVKSIAAKNVKQTIKKGPIKSPKVNKCAGIGVIECMMKHGQKPQVREIVRLKKDPLSYPVRIRHLSEQDRHGSIEDLKWSRHMRVEVRRETEREMARADMKKHMDFQDLYIPGENHRSGISPVQCRYDSLTKTPSSSTAAILENGVDKRKRLMTDSKKKMALKCMKKQLEKSLKESLRPQLELKGTTRNNSSSNAIGRQTSFMGIGRHESYINLCWENEETQV